MLLPASGSPYRYLSRVFSFLTLVSMALLLSACGNRGNLYLDSDDALDREIQRIDLDGGAELKPDPDEDEVPARKPRPSP